MLEEKKNGETYLRWTQVIGEQAVWIEMRGTRSTCPWQDSNVGCENYWDVRTQKKTLAMWIDWMNGPYEAVWTTWQNGVLTFDLSDINQVVN